MVDGKEVGEGVEDRMTNREDGVYVRAYRESQQTIV